MTIENPRRISSKKIIASEDAHRILGVNQGASSQEIKSNFRQLCREHHPDAAAKDTKKFQEINEAYQSLMAAPSELYQQNKSKIEGARLGDQLILITQIQRLAVSQEEKDDLIELVQQKRAELLLLDIRSSVAEYQLPKKFRIQQLRDQGLITEEAKKNLSESFE